jgi:hypothetical protein
MHRHLTGYPFDFVAHQAAAVMDGFPRRWSKSRPGYGTLLGSHAFDAEEAATTPAQRRSRATRPSSSR